MPPLQLQQRHQLVGRTILPCIGKFSVAHKNQPSKAELISVVTDQSENNQFGLFNFNLYNQSGELVGYQHLDSEEPIVKDTGLYVSYIATDYPVGDLKTEARQVYKGLGFKLYQIAQEVSHLMNRGGSTCLNSAPEAAPHHINRGYQLVHSNEPWNTFKYPHLKNLSVALDELTHQGEYDEAKSHGEKILEQGLNALSTQETPDSIAQVLSTKFEMREGLPSSQKTKVMNDSNHTTGCLQDDGKLGWIQRIKNAPVLYSTQQGLQNKTLILD